MSNFIPLLKDAMKSEGIDQGALASVAGCSQQTVSAWFRGTRKVSERHFRKLVLAFKSKQSRIALEKVYQQEFGAVLSLERDSRVVRDIELGHMTWSQFQEFCATFFKLRHELDKAEVREHGVQGDRQHGIDLVVRLPGNVEHTVQCKHVTRFGAADVRNAIKANTYKGAKNKYIVVSRRLTVAARDAIRSYEKKGWILWGLDDLTREIQFLPADLAERLLKLYAPGQIEHVLGRRSISPLETVESYFGRLNNPKVAGHHAIRLIGRDEELQALMKSVCDETIEATVLCAPGGEGKSRLMKAVLECVEDQVPKVNVRILDRGGKIDAFTPIEQYRGQPLVLAIEDAHERIDLDQIVKAFRERVSSVRFLVVTRPYTERSVTRSLESAGVINRRSVDLRRLTTDELADLAEETFRANKQSDPAFSRQIAKYTKGSSLFTVVAAQLSLKKRTALQRLSSDDLDRMVFGTYIDELFQAGDAHVARNARMLAELISLLQPCESDSSAFIELCHSYGRLSERDLNDALQYLLDRGLIIKSGHRVRVAPDMLADYMLEKLCIDVAGVARLPVQRLIGVLEANQLTNMLANLARLDWRKSAPGQEKQRLSQGLWPLIRELFDKGGKAQVLEALKRTSFYAPQATMRFCDSLPQSDGDVARALPEILKHAAYNFPEGTTEALQRLWVLGRDRQGDIDRDGHHPIAILREFVALTGHPRQDFAAAILDFAQKLLRSEADAGYAHHPLRFIEGMFSVEGHTTEMVGPNLVMRYRSVDYETVGPLRSALVDTVMPLLSSTSLRVATQAARTFSFAVRLPMGMVGGRAAEETIEALDREIVETIQKLHAYVSSNSIHALALIELARSVDWHAQYGNRLAKAPAARLLDLIWFKLDDRLLIELIDPWRHISIAGRGRDGLQSSELESSRRAILNEELGNLSGEEVVRRLSSMLRDIDSLDGYQSSPYSLLHELCALREDVAVAAIDEILTNSGSPWRRYAERPLNGLFRHNSLAALKATSDYLATKDVNLATATATAISWISPPDGKFDNDILELFRAFLQSTNEFAIRAVLHALPKVAEQSAEEALALVEATNLRVGRLVVHELCMMLTFSDEVKRTFTGEGWLRVLRKLNEAESFEDWEVAELLGIISAEHPFEVYRLLAKRIDAFSELEYSSTRRAIPHFESNGNHLKVFQSPYRNQVLIEVLDKIVQYESEWGPRGDYVDLFIACASGFSSETIAVLEGYAESNGPASMIAVAHVLREAGKEFVFAEVEFVRRMMNRADELGDPEALDAVKMAFYVSAAMGGKSGTYGQPFPEDIRMRDGAVEVLSKLSHAEPAWSLYDSLRRQAEAEIARERRLPDDIE